MKVNEKIAEKLQAKKVQDKIKDFLRDILIYELKHSEEGRPKFKDDYKAFIDNYTDKKRK